MLLAGNTRATVRCSHTRTSHSSINTSKTKRNESHPFFIKQQIETLGEAGYVDESVSLFGAVDALKKEKEQITKGLVSLLIN